MAVALTQAFVNPPHEVILPDGLKGKLTHLGFNYADGRTLCQVVVVPTDAQPVFRWLEPDAQVGVGSAGAEAS